MSYMMVKSCKVLVAAGGVSPELKAKGYAATLCAEVVPQNGKAHQFVDIHATREQLEALRESIDFFLEHGQGLPKKSGISQLAGKLLSRFKF